MTYRLDKSDALLLALYAGTLHCTGFDDVTASRMEMEKREFGWTLYILQMRGWIAGCVFQPPKPGSKDKLMGVLRDGLMLTPEGFQHAEALAKEANPEHGGTVAALLDGAFRALEGVGCGVMANFVFRWIG